MKNIGYPFILFKIKNKFLDCHKEEYYAAIILIVMIILMMMMIIIIIIIIITGIYNSRTLVYSGVAAMKQVNMTARAHYIFFDVIRRFMEISQQDITSVLERT